MWYPRCRGVPANLRCTREIRSAVFASMPTPAQVERWSTFSLGRPRADPQHAGHGGISAAAPRGGAVQLVMGRSGAVVAGVDRVVRDSADEAACFPGQGYYMPPHRWTRPWSRGCCLALGGRCERRSCRVAAEFRRGVGAVRGADRDRLRRRALRPRRGILRIVEEVTGRRHAPSDVRSATSQGARALLPRGARVMRRSALVAASRGARTVPGRPAGRPSAAGAGRGGQRVAPWDASPWCERSARLARPALRDRRRASRRGQGSSRRTSSFDDSSDTCGCGS